MKHPRATKLAGAMTLLASMALVGCSPKYYAPSTQCVPLLNERGDTAVSVAAGEGRVEFQGARALTGGLGAMVSVGFFEPKEDDQGDEGEGKLLEVGLGYYRALGPRFVFETYALAGTGEVENYFPSTLDDHPMTTGKISAKLSRFGIQTALGIESSHADGAVSARISSLSHRDVSGSLIFHGVDQVAYLRDAGTMVLFEPAVTLRAGYRSLRVQAQLGASFNWTNPDFRQEEGHATLGLLWRRSSR